MPMTPTKSIALISFSLSVLACDSRSVVSENPPNLAGHDTGPAIARDVKPLGEVVDTFPSDHERMVHVLTNMSRHAARNDCGDWTAEQGENVNKPPLVYSHIGNQAGRYMSKHMADLGCFQHESCCVLSNVGGNVECTSPASCSGAACGEECTGGTPTANRYHLLGMSSWSGENIARGQRSAYEVWCAWMKSDGHRANIYSGHSELGVGAYNASGSCSGWYWTQAFGSRGGSIPRIPVGSAMYAPPNPQDTSNVYFAANYYDSSGAAPKRSTVVIDGQCFDLERKWGYDGNGTYEARFEGPDELPPGCYPYYFLFVDSDANRHTYPDNGSLFVAIGNGVTCPKSYDSGQKPATCEGGTQTCSEGALQDCYTGLSGTESVGECRKGYQECRNGFWSSCRDQQLPFPELCDGVDNNCDGQTDEGNPGGDTSCSVDGERGECRAGTRQCLGGALACVSTTAPQVELCDGKDNDCDGVIDDGFGMITCGVGECFRTVNACDNGAANSCVPGTPSDEVADGKDNDCDGRVDDGFDCRKPDGSFGHARVCYSFPTSSIISPCKRGIQTCGADGEWGECVGEVGPSAEVCDRVDNDCDGDVDEPTDLGWQRCGTGQCTQWSMICKDGQMNTCAPLAPQAEACNGVDDSCDGTIDEGCSCRDGLQRPCYEGLAETRGVGECKEGVRVCQDGTWSACTGQVLPSTEYCDSFDQNCNGVSEGETCESLPGDGGTVGPGPNPQSDGGTATEPQEAAGCGCAAGSGSGAWMALIGLFALGGLRRRSNRISDRCA